MERKELTVTICMGLPASGKSTWTTEKLRNDPNTVRVSRDEFRFMLRNTPMTEPKIEEMIGGLVEKSIVAALKKRCNVIVDNCHVKASYVNPIIELVQYHADVEFMLFDVPAKKCIERDALRERKVGEEVINRMNEQFLILKDTFDFSRRPRKKEWEKPFPVYNPDPSKPTAVLFDIDGTLARMTNRGPYDWEKVGHDDLIEFVCEQTVFHHRAGRKIIVVSGRDEVCKNETSIWLQAAGVWYDDLLMRTKDDSRRDSVVKREIYETQIKDKYNVYCVYDDRLQVLDVWHKLGLFTFNVNQGNHEF